MKTRSLLASVLLVSGCAWPHALAAQDAGPPIAPGTRAASPWELSLAFESRNELTRARDVLVEAYGPQPAIYSVCVRLAWLSLRQGNAADAIQLYARARLLPGALPEATQGLVIALNMEGYRQLDRGNIPLARKHWRDALSADPASADAKAGFLLVGPSEGAAPELWAGALSASWNASTAQVLYATLPYRVDDELSVRGAYRRIGSPSATTGTTGTTGLFGSQDELFGGLTIEHGIGALDLVAFVISNTLSSTPGVAAAGRLGGRYGATLTVSAMSPSAGANLQAVPQAFAWVTPNLAINAGFRATHDASVSAVSPMAGVTIRLDRFSVDAQAHLGTERLAFNMAGPTVISFDASTSQGATVTASLDLDPRKRWTMFGQAQFEQLRSTDGVTDKGSYSGLAVGLRWIPVR